MSPILDLQQRLVEVGRIRMGHKNERNLPERLNTWRLTSQDKERLDIVAQVYGGKVEPWEKEFEVVTTSAALRIYMMPGHALTQWWEMWSGGGCLRRCDGYNEVISGGPCLCPAAMDERTEGASANPPTACRPTTRLSVLLPDIPGIGHWRLETHGFYAAVELAGTAGLLQMATAQGQVLPARLRIDQRHKIEGGQTTRWNVPVIDIDALLPEVLALHDAPVAEYTPMSAPPRATLDQGLRALEEGRTAPSTPRANAQEPIPPAASDVPAPEPPPEPPIGSPESRQQVLDSVIISHDQRKRLFAIAKELGLTEDEIRNTLKGVTGSDSTKDLTVTKYEEVIGALESNAQLKKELAELVAEPTPQEEPAPEPEPEAPAEEQAEEAGAKDATGQSEPASPPSLILGPEFTRHSGKPIAEVALEDPTYLAWLASDVIKDQAVRAAAQALLDQGGAA